MFEEGKDFYYNEEGLMVLTAEFLLRRGYCCGRGCKHCPYNWERVPDLLREKLLQEKDENLPKNFPKRE